LTRPRMTAVINTPRSEPGCGSFLADLSIKLRTKVLPLDEVEVEELELEELLELDEELDVEVELELTAAVELSNSIQQN